MEYNALMRKLPIGIQTFEKLRKENYLYVDKTEFVWKMAFASNPYFLSRPRRFGKSLLLSTFEPKLNHKVYCSSMQALFCAGFPAYFPLQAKERKL